MPYEQVYELAKSAWNNAAAENEGDFTEGFFAGHRAATAPPSDEPRPDDMAELARMVARELRTPKYAKMAAVFRTSGPNSHIAVWVLSVLYSQATLSLSPTWCPYIMFETRFDNLNAREIAEVIQAEEAKKAAKWAGDE